MKTFTLKKHTGKFHSLFTSVAYDVQLNGVTVYTSRHRALTSSAQELYSGDLETLYWIIPSIAFKRTLRIYHGHCKQVLKEGDYVDATVQLSRPSFWKLRYTSVLCGIPLVWSYPYTSTNKFKVIATHAETGQVVVRLKPGWSCKEGTLEIDNSLYAPYEKQTVNAAELESLLVFAAFTVMSIFHAQS
jgi:hypothetical protein